MKLNILSIALLLGLAAVSCTKEICTELPAPKGSEDLVTIRATFTGDEITKVGASSGFSWFWSEGDKLAVTGNADPQIFKISAGFSSKSAEFTGKAVEGESFTIQYPESGASGTSWEGQIQTGNNSIAHLKYQASLEGVDDYTTFEFNDAWASAHKGSLKQTGVLKIIMALPDTVKAVSKVSVAAGSPVFFTGNGDGKTDKLELEMTDVVPDAKHTVTAWMTTSWNEAAVKAGESLTVMVKIGEKSIERTMEFTKDGILMTGKVNVFDIDASSWSYGSHYGGGKGTAADPWIIYTLDQLLFMRDDLVDGDIRYFKLGADIDMAGVDWKSLNGAGTFGKQIDFDGAGHTLSNFTTTATTEYPSFFGVLYGRCANVNFVNANITTTANGVGIIGGYGGTASKPAVAENVHVQGKISAAGSVGGLFGNVRECTIDRCSADVEITATGQKVGGIFGTDNKGTVVVRNCWTAGIITDDSSICGGIGGDITVSGSSIYNCFSTMTVKTQFIFGGIAGRANLGAKTTKANCNSNDPGNHIEKCIAWNDSLESYKCVDGGEHYSSGAIIGGTATRNYLVDCIRKSDLNFVDCEKNASLGTYGLFDQDNADPDHAMVQGAGSYASAYHGKAAAAGKTLSAVAKDLGWSTDIWNLSSDIPVLK